jgi:hypothetical protein
LHNEPVGANRLLVEDRAKALTRLVITDHGEQIRLSPKCFQVRRRVGSAAG